METSVFTVEGMTCESCVSKVTDKLNQISDVKSVKVALATKKAEILSDRKILISEVSEALRELPKYKVKENTGAAVNQAEQSTFKTYKPLIIIFSYVFLISVAAQIYSGFNVHLFMNHIMAGFFIGLSFFKFLDLKSFAEAFSNYDPLAAKVRLYGFIYPFIELVLGLLFVSGIGLFYANILTIVVLSISTTGVIKILNTKSKFQCACLGAGFNLPLSYVTVTENLVMIIMATFSALNLLQP